MFSTYKHSACELSKGKKGEVDHVYEILFSGYSCGSSQSEYASSVPLELRTSPPGVRNSADTKSLGPQSKVLYMIQMMHLYNIHF